MRETEAPGTDILEYTGNPNLSPQQFGGVTVPDALDGPLGSYGEPGPAGTGMNGTGLARAGSRI